MWVPCCAHGFWFGGVVLFMEGDFGFWFMGFGVLAPGAL